MNDMTILHLSDLHIDNSGTNYSKLLQKLISDIKNEIKHIKDNSMIVVVTGDILHQARAYSEDKKAYDHAISFFHDLHEVLKQKAVGIYIVPGNHDKYRSENNKFLVPAYRAIDDELLERENRKASKFDKAFYETFWQCHIDTYSKEKGSGFLELTKEIYSIFGMTEEVMSGKTFIADTFGVDLIEVGDKKYCFVLLNTAWSCIDDNDDRNIIFGQFQIEKLRDQHLNLVGQYEGSEDIDLTIVLGHHPLSSLRGREEDKIFAEMISFDSLDANVYLSGHTHDRTVTNWVNNRHSFNTFVTGIGWPENAGGQHVGSHTYSMYVFNLNVNSIDVYVRSTNDGGAFSPDFRIYNSQESSERKKLVFPIRAQEAQTYIPLNVGDSRSPKAYYISKEFMCYIHNYVKKIERMHSVIGMMIEQDKLDFYVNTTNNKNRAKLNDDPDDSLYSYFFAFTNSTFQEISEEISGILLEQSLVLYQMFLSFLQKLCQKMQQLLVEDLCEEGDIVRFHFRYLADRKSLQYLSLCTSFPTSIDSTIHGVSEIKYGQLIEKAYESGRSLIYSVNKEFVQKPLNTKWKNFITVIPAFDKNKYTHKYVTVSKQYPFLTFGVTTNNCKFDDLLYCMDYFSIEDTLGRILEQYIETFNINIDSFCNWARYSLETGGDSESEHV